MKPNTCKKIIWPLFAVLWGVAIPSVKAAHFGEVPSALVIMAPDGRANEFSPVVEFSKVEYESALALKVVLPNGQSTSIPKVQVAQIFKYPDPNQQLTEQSDINELNAKKQEATGLASRFGKAKPFLTPIIASIDADLAKLAAGQIRYHNQWTTRAEFERGHHDVADSVDFASLTVGLKTYRSVQILKVENEAVSLKHEGGVGRVDLREATPELIARIYARPELLKGFRPLAQIMLEGKALSRAVLTSHPPGQFRIFHQGGVLQVDEASVNDDQKKQLLESNPALLRPAPVVAAVTAPTPAATPVKSPSGYSGINKPNAPDPKAETVPEIVAQYLNDKPGIPNVSVESGTPDYETTMEFVNGMLHGSGVKMWMGENTGKMIIDAYAYGNAARVYVFDPSKLTPEVKFSKVGNSVTLSTTNRQPVILSINKMTGAKGETNSLTFRAPDNLDKEKLISAFAHLIEMFGGKPDAF